MDLRKEKSSPAVQESFFAFGFVVLFGAGAPPGRPASVTLDPFLSLPWPVVLTRAKRVWRRGHPAQRDAGPVPFFAFAGCVHLGKEKAPLVAAWRRCHIRGDCEAKQFQPAFIQLPSAAAQYGCPDTGPTGLFCGTLPGLYNSPFRCWLASTGAQEQTAHTAGESLAVRTPDLGHGTGSAEHTYGSGGKRGDCK